MCVPARMRDKHNMLLTMRLVFSFQLPSTREHTFVGASECAWGVCGLASEMAIVTHHDQFEVLASETNKARHVRRV